MRLLDYPTGLVLVKPQNEAAFVHLKQLERLKKIAHMLLDMGGTPEQAEILLDELVDSLIDGGCMSTWSYRVLLSMIRREEVAQ